MPNAIVRVSRATGESWSVRELQRTTSTQFRLKSHAVAHARALSYSRKLILLVDDDCGLPVRQSTASMSYPTHLD